MFYYYGGKKRLASRYDAPVYPVVVEPFAGGAAYSLYHLRGLERAVLVEKDARVVAAWRRLLALSPAELRAYPVPEPGERTDDFLVMTATASNAAASSSGLTLSPRATAKARAMFRLMADEMERLGSKLRRIEIVHGDYTDAPDIEATWLIDPPYQPNRGGGSKQGNGYAPNCNADALDFDALARWAMSRRGQVIVCEQEGATWLPFRPLRSTTNTLSGRSREVVWTNGWGQGDLLSLAVAEGSPR